MNAAQVIDHFDRISDAPDAFPRLRRFILDLAVRGKLVEQDPNDEPASELLKRIQSENARQIKNGKLEQQTTLLSSKDVDVPFLVPDSWAWVRLGTLAVKITDGEHLSPKKTMSGMPLLTATHVTAQGLTLNNPQFVSVEDGHKSRERCDPRPGDVLVCSRGTIGRCAVVNTHEIFCLMGSVILIRFPTECSPVYFNYFLSTDRAQAQMRGMSGATAVHALYLKDIRLCPVAIPPLAEQQRIVSKVDELMALCDRLESAQVERESRRDKLAAASLHRLNNGGDADEFREHARFHLHHLPRLTTRPEHMQGLRQTILNLAVRGKLVPQDPNDEPASELVNRIREEKAQQMKTGEIKISDTIAALRKSDSPLHLPSGWVLAALQSVCISVTDGDHLPPPKTEHGIPFLVIGNVRTRAVNFVGCRHVSEEYYNSLDSSRRPQKSDVLYTLVGSFGIPVMITDNRPFCVQRHIGILRPSMALNVSFLTRVLESEWALDQASACATGIAQKTVPLSGLRKMGIPLPPLAEQHRIVAKVDQLMAVCDRLETQLTSTQTENRRLLEAVLHDALNGST